VAADWSDLSRLCPSSLILLNIGSRRYLSRTLVSVEFIFFQPNCDGFLRNSLPVMIAAAQNFGLAPMDGMIFCSATADFSN
jgi:hypothetical protein